MRQFHHTDRLSKVRSNITKNYFIEEFRFYINIKEIRKKKVDFWKISQNQKIEQAYSKKNPLVST